MGLFSFLGKNKQETAAGESEFYSRAEEESQAARGKAKRKRGKAAKSDPIDPVLPEKKRARRRLVGAVALVLAVIIGLPMILDSEPKPVADDIAVQIPSKDKLPPLPPADPASYAQPEQINSTPAADATATSAASAKTSTSAVPLTSVPTGTGKPEAKVPDAAHAADSSKANSTTQATAEKAAPKSANAKTAENKPADAKPTEAKAALKAGQHAAEKPDDARGEAILEGRDVDAKSDASKKPGKFMVQVAALASQDKVNELQGKLSDAGFKSYTQKVPTASGERIRVRIGPFASKDEATSTMAKLGKLGLNAKLVSS